MEAKVLDKPLIGVPVFQDRECFEEMMYSLMASTDWYEKIIIIESDGDIEYWEKYKGKRIEVIHMNKDGPTRAYNKLFKIAKERNKDLLITQTDVLFPKLYKRDWLNIMNQIANNNEVGLVIPVNGGGYSGEDYLKGFPWVGGWCTYISKKCWEIFNGYDEMYPMGYGVDIDMTYQIGLKYKIRVLNYWVDHHMNNLREHDNNPKSEEAKKIAGTLFKRKWKL